MNTKGKKKDKSNSSQDLDFLKIQYQVLSSRQINHNNMIWNVPTLLFVVQSLLWTIALNIDIHIIIRLLLSLVSVIMGFMSIQAFQRTRLMEIVDSEQLYSIEKLFLGLRKEKNQKSALIIHHQIKKRTVISEQGDESVINILSEKDFFRKGKLVHIKSFNLWLIAFWLIFGLSIIIALYNLYYLLATYKILDFLQS